MKLPKFYKWVEDHKISFLGVVTLRNPIDAWMIQQIMWTNRPNFLVETGTFMGGSALYYASMFDLMGSGKVISIDNNPVAGGPRHPRIEYMVGSSVNEGIVNQVREQVSGRSCMVILDSEHSYDHVKAELETYSQIVTPGQYLVVEDGNPCTEVVQACDEFLASHHLEFERLDEFDEVLYEISFNYRGWFRRAAA